MSRPFDPKSTIFTNDMLDIIMPSVSPNAWKILCFAMRKTAGWQDITTLSGRKESDVISLSQFREGCGISKNDTVISAIQECLDKNYLIRIEEGQSFRYSLNTDYELPTSPENGLVSRVTSPKNGLVTSPENGQTNNNINNNLINTNGQEKLQKEKLSADNYRVQTIQSIAKGLAKHQADGLENYPEDVRDVLDIFCQLWNFKPPRGRDPAKNQSMADWIKSGRDLLDACGEFGVDVLRGVREDFEDYMCKNHGIAPFRVNSPRSLVNAARGKAAEMRSPDTHTQIPLNMEVYLGNGKKLVPGIGIVDASA
jgi:hypothetical protein